MTPEDLNLLLAAGVQHGASDIHLKAGDPPTYRVKGALAPLKYNRLTPADTAAITRLLVKVGDLERRWDTAIHYATNPADLQRAMSFDK